MVICTKREEANSPFTYRARPFLVVKTQTAPLAVDEAGGGVGGEVDRGGGAEVVLREVVDGCCAGCRSSSSEGIRTGGLVSWV